eukprot:1152288-Pelagomonas_calceolata.AAC.10
MLFWGMLVPKSYGLRLCAGTEYDRALCQACTCPNHKGLTMSWSMHTHPNHSPLSFWVATLGAQRVVAEEVVVAVVAAGGA